MSLSQETQNELGRRLAKTNLGNLILGFDGACEKGMLWELLENQFAIMQVLAEMNGMSPNPKFYNDLLD